MKVKVSGYLFVAGCCLTLALPFAAQDKNLALTPPMGWNSWNHFATGRPDLCEMGDRLSEVRLVQVGRQS